MSAAVAPFYGFAHTAVPALDITVRAVNIPDVGYRYVIAAIGDSGDLQPMCLTEEGSRYITAYYARRAVWDFARRIAREGLITVNYHWDWER